MELSKLQELTQAKLAELGFELISLNLTTNKGEKVLSIVVDRVEPIDMDAIVEISHKLNEFYDEIDPIEDEYTLDISSLGAEKPLKIDELDKYVDRYINVHLVNPINGENVYEGTLVAVSEEIITLSYRQKTRTKTVDIQKSNISKIRLAIKF